MLSRALAAGVPAARLTADEVYGSDYQLRRFCEDQWGHYVVQFLPQHISILMDVAKR